MLGVAGLQALDAKFFERWKTLTEEKIPLWTMDSPPRLESTPLYLKHQVLVEDALVPKAYSEPLCPWGMAQMPEPPGAAQLAVQKVISFRHQKLAIPGVHSHPHRADARQAVTASSTMSTLFALVLSRLVQEVTWLQVGLCWQRAYYCGVAGQGFLVCVAGPYMTQ